MVMEKRIIMLNLKNKDEKELKLLMRKLGEMLRVRSMKSIKESKEVKKIIPNRCIKCNSENIIGHGLVIGMAKINLDTLEVDECGDDFEICDEENLRYECWDCGREWE